jgi:arylsulfatase
MPESPRPHLLLLCCDHLRWDWLGCNGHPLVQSPQIDKLAYAGVNFQRAFSECPVCVPARRILMTGRGPYGVHMNQNRDLQPFPEGPKLAEVLTRAGWQTFAAGKLHVHPQRNRIGFEDVQLNEEGRLQSGARLDDYERWLRDHGFAHRAYTHGLGNNQYGLRLSPLPEEATTTHWTAQRAMEFVERRDPTRPFFLYVSFDKPHPPITPPASYYELYRDATFPAPVMGDWLPAKITPRIEQARAAHNYPDLLRQPGPIQQSLRGFAALITHLDSMIGAILGTLREEGVLQDTWIVFTSDHGDQLFDHGHFAKGDFFHGSTRVPFIVRPPDAWRTAHGLHAGRIDTRTPVGLADLMPTLLDLAGVESPSDLDGQSLLPLLRTGDRSTFRPHTCGHITTHYGISDGRYRYQWEASTGLEFLFDQDRDPCDEHDLAGAPAHAGRLAELRRSLTTWMAAHDDPHARGGQLVPAPREHGPDRGHSPNPWNNRGRH